MKDIKAEIEELSMRVAMLQRQARTMRGAISGRWTANLNITRSVRKGDTLTVDGNMMIHMAGSDMVHFKNLELKKLGSRGWALRGSTGDHTANRVFQLILDQDDSLIEDLEA